MLSESCMNPEPRARVMSARILCVGLGYMQVLRHSWYYSRIVAKLLHKVFGTSNYVPQQLWILKRRKFKVQSLKFNVPRMRLCTAASCTVEAPCRSLIAVQSIFPCSALVSDVIPPNFTAAHYAGRPIL